MNDKEKLQNLRAYEKFTCRPIDSLQRKRAAKEPDGCIFVYGYRKKRYGRRYQNIDDFLSFHTDIKTEEDKDKEKLWKRKIINITKRLEKSNLWPELKIIFQNLQTMSWTDWNQLSELMWSKIGNSDFRNDPEIQPWIQKYPFLFETHNDGTISFNHYYINEMCKGITKPMYFGSQNRQYKDLIKDHIQNQSPYTIYRIPVGYDVSFEYNAKEQKAWYSEEYRHCGNGHYYIALDHSCALFIETD